MIDELINLCVEKKIMISVCESLTGGKIVSSIIEKPGASKVVYEGIVAYSNNSKIKRLYVKDDTLNKYGAVSREVAIEMAEGLYKSGEVAFTVSTTGIAGPSGGSLDKPVGLTYIGVCNGRETKAIGYIFKGDRGSISNLAANKAIENLIYEIKNFK